MVIRHKDLNLYKYYAIVTIDIYMIAQYERYA